MANLTKKQLIEEIMTIYDKTVEYFHNELKDLYENGNITYGSYHYLLSPFNAHCFDEFFGRDNKAPMFGYTKQKRVKIWNFEYTLRQAKQLLAEIEEVIRIKEHII